MKKNSRNLMVFACLVCACLLYGCTGIMNDGIPGQKKNNSQVNEVTKNNDLGYKLMDQDKPEEAIVYFKKALDNVYQVDPSLRDLTEEKKSTGHLDTPFNNLSWAYNELGKHEESLKYIEKALLILPNTDAEYVNKGNALYGLSRGDEALVYYDLAIKLNKDCDSAYYGRGAVNYNNQKYNVALKEFNIYLRAKPNDLEAADYKVSTLLQLEQKQEALAYADTVIANNLDKYDAYLLKATILEKSGQYEDIKKFDEETSKMFPHNLEAQIKLGQLHYNYGYYNLSLDLFNDLLKKHTDHMELYTWVLYNYSKLGDFDNAKATFNKAIQIDSKSADIYSAMGSAYVNNTQYMEALEYLDKSIELNPTNERALQKARI
ncbi:tetratricopeptide repeat protein [Paenibacillus psychroresistens]|uniref:Tetratricopeptide repeat protein n=1 Tax=Paenibacillus psychroresistens TaxID=1778678 RepID=A0A6B8RX59_9BACL|nr:tetratricopeptide repeat protein [Paenibacillus psychroresistens]QGQ99746.1 tetratricopeptide repeat protein [Paenibacillus psychroresistens]